jgi:hypothetical protein
MITDLLAGPYAILIRWAAIGLLAISLFGAGWIKRGQHDESIRLEEVGKAAIATIHLARARDRITTVVETKYLPQIEREKVVTQTITKEVRVYVPTSTPDLPGGFRVLHDDAAQGLIPDPARIADAAAVAAEDVAGTVAENYGTCRVDKTRLAGLQKWVNQQLKANEGVPASP